MNLGLLLLRLLLAGLLVGHATQKLFGWFRGTGLAATGATFEQWGFRPGAAMAMIAAGCELAGAGSIAFGLLTPGGCAIVIGTMIVAAAPNAPNGLWAHQGGCEVPVAYAGLAAGLACTGPGRFSADRALGLAPADYTYWGLAAIALGVLAAIPVLLRRRATLRGGARTSDTLGA